MNRLLGLCLLGGLAGIGIGGYQCFLGHDYSVAAQHEASVVGRVISVHHGKGGPSYRYVFSVNGINMDDTSGTCATPLALHACEDNGPVMVYYSYQPYSNSLLQDFTDASTDAYHTGVVSLGIGFPLLGLAWIGNFILRRKGSSDDDPEPEDDEEGDAASDEPDAIHVTPHH